MRPVAQAGQRLCARLAARPAPFGGSTTLTDIAVRWQSSVSSSTGAAAATPVPGAVDSGSGAAATPAASRIDSATAAPVRDAKGGLPIANLSTLDAAARLRAAQREPGAARASALDADAYGWAPGQRAGKQAPLWMVYEAEREDAVVRKTVGAGERESKDTRAEIEAPMLDAAGRAYATGRRKAAVAQVWLGPGDGNITVNGKAVAEYFARVVHRKTAIEPFVMTQSCGAFDVTATVRGGGESGQAGALKHGIAHALARYDPFLKPVLRKCEYADIAAAAAAAAVVAVVALM